MGDIENLFTKRVLAWYKKHKRDLPWRRTDDPYRILVSEMMLQQTQVSRVIPKYEAFLQAYPTANDLAKSSLADVFRLWSGLGYNRRAKYLREACIAVVKECNGVFPQKLEELQSLPGIGPYTAGAIMAFAYNKPVVVIDANVKNVFNKVFGIAEKEIPHKVMQCVPSKNARDFYNALMDIGSQYYNTNSTYDEYPFKEFCKWHNGYDIPSLKKVKQASFKDSNRFYRGQLMKQLSSAPYLSDTFEDVRYADAAAQLEKEGFIVREKGKLYLKE